MNLEPKYLVVRYPPEEDACPRIVGEELFPTLKKAKHYVDKELDYRPGLQKFRIYAVTTCYDIGFKREKYSTMGVNVCMNPRVNVCYPSPSAQQNPTPDGPQ